MTRRFSRLLVANRGEIACRILRSANALGYRTFAIYSEADAQALHVQMADEAVCVGPAPVGESYLHIERIVAAARACGAEAIHPGYGFLSENAAFAEACDMAGLVFVGPSAKALARMGDKAEAKRIAHAAGVACVPGYQGEAQDDAVLLAEAERIGFPVLLKAAAGGGGRGMRRVKAKSEFAEALLGARLEAQGAFASGILLVEKLIENARHVEIQILADTDGNCIHLGERDCSVQRRHQKTIEEAPCPVMTPELREAMGAAAVTIARAAEYTNAGTVEFLLDADNHFYFLEMNARLQVEHPVTEWVTGRDLVRDQLRIAQGDALEAAPPGAFPRGHAIEARIYAEDPARDFMPQAGRIALWKAPDESGGGIRVDSGIRSGDCVTPYYDPLLAKIIAHGDTREDARAQLIRALRATALLGIETNIEMLLRILEDERFAQGQVTTSYLESSALLRSEKEKPGAQRLLLAAAIWIERAARQHPASMRGWRSTGPAHIPLRLAWNEAIFALDVSMRGAQYACICDGVPAALCLQTFEADGVSWRAGEDRHRATYVIAGDELYLHGEGRADRFVDVTYAPPLVAQGIADGVLKAPMVGQVMELRVRAGEAVAQGDTLLVLEAMKMVNNIVAPHDGTVESVLVARGDQVRTNQVLLTVAPHAAKREGDAHEG